MNLGEKIKQMRNQLGLTQAELADRCELTKGYISQLENDLNKLKSLRNVDSRVSQSNFLQKAGQVMQVAAVGTIAPESKKIKVSSTFDWAIGY